jgi:putative DNA primase/helicase
VKLIPFEVKFSKIPAECPPALPMDKDLWGKLRAELPGILAWAVAGAVAWQRDGGLKPPASITDAVAGYRTEQDIVAQFLGSETTADPAATTPVKDLYTAFRTWCTSSGERDAPKQRWFTERVQNRYRIEHKRDGNHFVGLRSHQQGVDLQSVNLNEVQV